MAVLSKHTLKTRLIGRGQGPRSAMAWRWETPAGRKVPSIGSGSQFIIPYEGMRVSNLSQTGVDLFGYIYAIKDNLGNIIDYWPMPPSQLSNAKFAYSVLTTQTPLNIQRVSDSELSIACYPNPTYSWVTLECNSAFAYQSKVLVYDLLGKQVLEEKVLSFEAGHTQKTIDVSSLSAGNYVIQLSNSARHYRLKLTKL
jgi:hypothetical protein